MINRELEGVLKKGSRRVELKYTQHSESIKVDFM